MIEELVGFRLQLGLSLPSSEFNMSNPVDELAPIRSGQVERGHLCRLGENRCGRVRRKGSAHHHLLHLRGRLANIAN